MNPWKGLRELPRGMWILFTATLINRAGTMVLPFLALYLTEKLGEPASNAGLVLAFYGIGALVTAQYVGKISDRYGAIKIIKLSLIISGMILSVYPFLKDFYLIITATLIWSVINEAYRPAILSIISDIVTKEQRRPAYALNRMAANLGMSIGPVAGGFLVLINFSAIFYVDAITSFAAGAFLIFTSWKPAPHHAESSADEQTAHEKKSVYADRRLIYFLLALLPIPVIYLQNHSTMPIFLVQNLKFLESTYGILFTINTVLIILIEVPLNNSIRSWSDRAALSTGAFLCAVGFGGMAFCKDIYGIIATIVIWTFGEMIFFPAASAYMSEIAPEG